MSPNKTTTYASPFQDELLDDVEVAARFARGELQRLTDLDPSLPRADVVAELRERCRSMAPFDVALGRRATHVVAAFYRRYGWSPDFWWLSMHQQKRARVARGELPDDLGAVAPLRDKRQLGQGYYERLADAANPDGDHERFYDPPDGADK